jgi:HEAT repeat protein
MADDAAKALRKMSDTRAIEDLISISLKGDSCSNRSDAAMALDVSALEMAADWIKDGVCSGTELEGKTDPHSIAQLIPLTLRTLKDANWEARARAARALGEIKDERGVDPLIATLTDPDPGTRAQAAWALGEFRNTRATNPLIATLTDADSSVREETAGALVKVADPASNGALLEAWSRRDYSVIVGARSFFIGRGDPGSEDVLIEMLHKFGKTWVAEDLLNSGNPKLEEAARTWGQANGFTVVYGGGGARAVGQ